MQDYQISDCSVGKMKTFSLLDNRWKITGKNFWQAASKTILEEFLELPYSRYVNKQLSRLCKTQAINPYNSSKKRCSQKEYKYLR